MGAAEWTVVGGFVAGWLVYGLHCHRTDRAEGAERAKELADALRHEPKAPGTSALPLPGMTIHDAFEHLAERVDELTRRVEEMERRGSGR